MKFYRRNKKLEETISDKSYQIIKDNFQAFVSSFFDVQIGGFRYEEKNF